MGCRGRHWPCSMVSRKEGGDDNGTTAAAQTESPVAGPGATPTRA